MYIKRSQTTSVTIDLELQSHRGKAETKALLDSGATENFIDPDTIKQLGLGTITLKDPRWVRNVDGTLNKAGSVTQATDLFVIRGGKKIKQRFYITALGSDRMILGFPWFQEFDPKDIDWKKGILTGLKVTLETLLFRRFANLKDKLKLQKQQINSDIVMELDQVYCDPVSGVTPQEIGEGRLECQIRRTQNAVEMAYKFRETNSQTEIILPDEFKQFEAVFSDEEAKKMPPR